MERACIAIGSNLGDRLAAFDHARRGLAGLPESELAAFADPIETDPIGPGEQGRYLNGAAVVRTGLGARELLGHLLRIERECGRERRSEQRWGPRTLDLDLLLLGDRVIDEAGLTIPHPRMHERAFVLAPLATIAPDTRHPVLDRTVAQLLAGLGGAATAYAEP